MFEAGDPVIHPIRGAGVVLGVEERSRQDGSRQYYRIRLLSEPGTTVMIPVDVADELGLREAIPRSKLGRVWRVFHARPGTLPTDHKARYKVLEERLHTGDVLQVAEAVRDIAWHQEREGRLTTVGKRIYERGLALLAGEVAAAQGTDLSEAEAQVRAELQQGMSPAAVA